MKKYVLLFALMGLTFSTWSQFVPLEGSLVTVQSFDLTKNGNTIQLQWKVACFLDQATFTIQRSSNGIDYSTINHFTADKARCSQPFYYTDHNITGRVYYRVKVSDKDGNIYASKIVSATGANSGYNVNSVWPTFVTSDMLVNISATSSEKIVLYATSLSGRRVWQKAIRLQPGSNDIRINLAALSKGNYVLTSVDPLGELSSVRFVKQ